MTDIGNEACPFCGKSEYVRARKCLIHEDGEEDFYWGYNAICDASGVAGTAGCGAQAGWQETVEEALAAWNRRAIPA